MSARLAEGSKTRCRGASHAGPMGEPLSELVNRIENLEDRDLVYLLSIVAAAVADRLIATEQEGLEAERIAAEDLAAAPWRLAKGKAKGKGKGHEKGRNNHGKGPYGK